MKKYLFTLLVYLCCSQVYGQSISLINLINLTSLNNQQAGDNLTSAKVWALQFGEQVDGFVAEHYQTAAPADKIETIIVGVGAKTSSGAVLHTVSYLSANVQNIINLVGQTKNSGLTLFFRGSDKADNIYIYENFLYHMVVRIALDNAKATIDVTQKQVFAE